MISDRVPQTESLTLLYHVILFSLAGYNAGLAASPAFLTAYLCREILSASGCEMTAFYTFIILVSNYPLLRGVYLVAAETDCEPYR